MAKRSGNFNPLFCRLLAHRRPSVIPSEECEIFSDQESLPPISPIVVTVMADARIERNYQDQDHHKSKDGLLQISNSFNGVLQTKKSGEPRLVLFGGKLPVQW